MCIMNFDIQRKNAVFVCLYFERLVSSKDYFTNTVRPFIYYNVALPFALSSFDVRIEQGLCRI